MLIGWISRRTAAVLWLLVAFAMTPLAHAQQGVCAEVKIEIQQRLNLERQGFIATMRIGNGADGVSLTGVGVNVKFADRNGLPVLATSDPNNTSASFFIRVDSESNITGGVAGGGVIAPQTSAEIRWLIIPASGAGGTTAAGEIYGVGATLTYMLGTEARTVEVTPETITVRPQPKLQLDYFLPFDVYADDALTPELEPSEPFTLGVRVRNVGGGASANTRIESAQPRIVENAQGLAIGFQIDQSYIQDQPAQRTLLLDFGDLAGGSSKVGRWVMSTTLAGRFTEFTASYTHADALGGALTSLIDRVDTHTLLRDVRVDLPGRDSVRDFLARSGDTLRVFESSGIDTVVVEQTGSLQAPGSGDWTLTIPATVGAAYARFTDPTSGQSVIASAIRADGKVMPVENVWFSKTGQGADTRYYLNLFDTNTAGVYTIRRNGSVNLGSLAGSVYDDTNSNGVRDVGEPGLSNVLMTLSGITSAGSVSRSVNTGVNGEFVFETLAAGTYSVAVGLVAGRENGPSLAGTGGGIAGADSIDGIQLVAGAQLTGYAFSKRIPVQASTADLEIALTAAPTSVVIGSDSVIDVVVRNRGPSVSVATVALNIPSQFSVQSGVATAGTVNLAGTEWVVGALPVDGLASLRLNLRADSAGDGLMQVAVSGSASDPTLANNSASVTLTATESAPLAAISGLVYDDTNANGIRDAGEPGLAGVTMSLSVSAPSAPVLLTVDTDNDGNYSFVGLAAGSYDVLVGAVEGRINGPHLVGGDGSGTPIGTAGPDAITAITAVAGAQLGGYVFSKRIPPPPAADLSVSVVAAPTSVTVGGNSVVDVVVRNLGPTATTATLSYSIPASFSLIASTPTTGSVNLVLREWTLGTLAADGEASLRLTLRADSVGTGDVIGQISGSVADPQAGNNAASIGLTATADTPPLTMTQSLGDRPRILGLAVCPPTAQPATCAATRAAELAGYLNGIGLETRIETQAYLFREALRSGRYNLVWISGGAAPLIDQLAEEVREFVRGGGSLVLDGARDGRSTVFDEVLGTRHIGALAGVATMIVVGQAAGATVDLPITGSAFDIDNQGGVVLARFRDRDDPAIVTHQFGRGRVLHAAFELGSSLVAAGPGNLDWRATTEVLLTGLVSADSAQVVGLGMIRLVSEVSNTGPDPTEVDIVVRLPDGARVAASDLGEPVSSGQTRTWRTTVAAAETRRIVVDIRAPLASASHTIETSLHRVLAGGGNTPVQTVTQPMVVVSGAQRFATVIAAIRGLSFVDPAHVTARDAAALALESARTRIALAKFDAAMVDLMMATARLSVLPGTSIIESRNELALLAREAGHLWQGRAPRCGIAEATPVAADESAFYAYSLLERLEVQGGHQGNSDWEWAVGSNTQQANQRATVANRKWVSGRIYNWDLVFTSQGRATLTVRDADGTISTASYTATPGMRSGEAIRLYAKADADVGSATIRASVTRLNGATTSASVATVGNGSFNESSQVLYFPAMRQGLAAQGTLRLDFTGNKPPEGTRLNVLLNSGEMACRAELAP